MEPEARNASANHPHSRSASRAHVALGGLSLFILLLLTLTGRAAWLMSSTSGTKQAAVLLGYVGFARAGGGRFPYSTADTTTAPSSSSPSSSSSSSNFELNGKKNSSSSGSSSSSSSFFGVVDWDGGSVTDGGDVSAASDGAVPPVSPRVLPGQTVAAFVVETPAGPFRYDPSTSSLPVVAVVLNPQDPFQRAMWADWSLQMFLRQAPLAAVDYLFVPYAYSPAAATDMSYYMYSRMMAAARVVYGSNETTDEDLRKRVFSHLHFSTTQATAISPQIVQLMSQWTVDMRVLRARRQWARGPPSQPPEPPEPPEPPSSSSTGATADGVAMAVAVASAGEDGLRVGRLDAWYGWLPSPGAACPDPSPLVAFDDVNRAAAAAAAAATDTGRSPCDPIDDGGGGGGGARFAGAWVVVSNTSREDRPDCAYGDIILNLQRVGALGVIFAASPGRDVELIAPFDLDGDDGPELLFGGGGGGGRGPDPAAAAAAAARRTARGVAAAAAGGKGWRREGGRMAATGGGGGDDDGEGKDEQPCIPATMVSYSDGIDLLALLSDAAAANVSVEVDFDVKTVPTGWFAIDPWVGLAEAGWAQLPAMMHAGWAAWWHVYLGRLRRQLSELETDPSATDRPAGAGADAHADDADDDDADADANGDDAAVNGGGGDGHVVTVFEDQPFPGPHGATAVVELPRHLRSRSRHRRGRFRRLLLDFSLGCPGPMDSSCPAWDHMVQLFACCDPRVESCRPCPTTLWRPPPESEPEPEPAPQRCGFELGRWASPFRRRVGRWLTDVTPLMALLGDGGRCSFTVQTAPWADGNWTASLTLMFVRQPPAGAPAEVEVGDEDEEEEEEEEARDGLGTAVPGGVVSEVPGEPGGEESGAAEEGRGAAGEGGVRSRRHLIAATAAAAAGDSTPWHLSGAAHRLANPAGTSGAIARGVSVRATEGGYVAADTDADADADAKGTSMTSAAAAAAVAKPPFERGLRPAGVLPLYESAVFDASYNRDRPAVAFAMPRGARAATVVSYITGHGSDAAAGCGEFCPTSHHLYVNGLELAVRNFTAAGTAWGCADAVLYGGVPNQHGTWFYGRGGWCDGAPVEPWVVDVSAALWPPGSAVNNTIWIKGLYGDRQEPVDPPEGSTAGYIMMQSLLVFFE